MLIRRNTTALGGNIANRFFASPAPTCTDTIASNTSPDGGTASDAALTPAPIRILYGRADPETVSAVTSATPSRTS
ncbi:hypothetical protein Aple_074410 [Acrocarpospora pleiomorpha]|uniref:Uncharacterized protein n=1 Tax=Acrocarpospora pleiomorpha TaxID=90975 RepID=A0A5M3XU16_9ACTN|nr:hypothetical protein Aple_074410 [Acrocarpospora pleiomorpha]